MQDTFSFDDERAGLDAVARLSGEDTPEAMLGLIELLGARHWRVRKAASESLQGMASRDVVDTLVEIIRSRVLDENALNTAIQVLTSVGAEVVSPISSLLSEPDPQVRLHAAQTLGLLHEPLGVTHLRKALSDRDENVRFHVVEALAELRDLGSVPLLLDRLDEESPYVRFAIVDALGSIGDARAVPALIPLLQDEMLRPAVVRALGYFADERPVPHLVALLQSDHDLGLDVAKALVSIQERYEREFGERTNIAELVRQAAPRGLGEDLLGRVDGPSDTAWIHLLSWLRPPGIAAFLLRLLHSDDERKRAADVLSTLGPDSIDLLSGELSDDDPEVRKAAAVVLGRRGSRRVSGQLVELLDDEVAPVRQASAAALARLGDAGVLDNLVAHLDDEDALVRQAIVEAINSIGSPRTLDRILPLLETGSTRSMEAAVKILGYFGYPEALDAILAKLEDEDEMVQRAAISVLPYFEDPRALHALLAALDSPSPRTRGEAVRAIARTGAPETPGAVIRALRDPAPWVRYKACIAISELGGVSSKDIVPLLHDPAPMVRVAACRAAGRTRDRLPVEELVLLTTDEDPEVRFAALSVLTTVRHPVALEALRKALESEVPQARITAALGLAGFGRRGLGPLVELARSDRNEDVRRAALEALAGIGTPAAVEALLNLSEDPRLRDHAVADLVAVAAEAVPVLARIARRRNTGVALTAVDVLTRLRRPEATEVLAELAGSSLVQAQVREGALEGLDVLGRTDLLRRDGPA